MNRKEWTGLVIYDGSCGLCAGNLKWLHRLDWLGCFEDLPYQDPSLGTRAPGLTPEVCAEALYLVFSDGRKFRGADAFREVFLRMPLTLPLGLIMAVPPFPWISRKLYPFIARNRYRLGGTCSLHEKKD